MCVLCVFTTVSRLVVPKSNNPRVLLCDWLDFPNWKTLRVHLTNIWEESFALDCHCDEYVHPSSEVPLSGVMTIKHNMHVLNYITLEPCIICRSTWCSGFLEVACPEFKVHIQQSRQGTDSLCPIGNNETHIVWRQDVWLLNRATACCGCSYTSQHTTTMSPIWEQVAYPIRWQAEANGIPGMHRCPGRSTILGWCGRNPWWCRGWWRWWQWCPGHVWMLTQKGFNDMIGWLYTKRKVIIQTMRETCTMFSVN